MGFPARLIRPIEAMYGRLLRRFKFAGGVGEEFLATNGILQGCPISVILLNALISVWAHAIEAEVPDAEPDAFADDTGAVSCDAETIQSVADVTDVFASLTRQELSLKKSFVFCTDADVDFCISLAGNPL